MYFNFSMFSIKIWKCHLLSAKFFNFIATAESGRISQAAIALNVSQSTITTAIKGLEELLETRLFDRLPHGVILTYEGHQFLQHARHISAAMEEAMRLPSRANASIKGTINLVVSFTVAGYFLPPYLSRFTRSFPNIEVSLEEANREDIEKGIIGGKYDLAMMLASNLGNQEDILVEILFRSRRRLWLSSEHRLAEESSISLRDLSHEPYIMLTVDEADNTALRYWNQTPYRPNVIFRTSSVEAVRSMVANGTGVSILSDMVYRPWSLEGLRLKVTSVTDLIPTMDVGLASSRNSKRSPATSAFCEFLHLAMASTQPLVPALKI